MELTKEAPTAIGAEKIVQNTQANNSTTSGTQLFLQAVFENAVQGELIYIGNKYYPYPLEQLDALSTHPAYCCISSVNGELNDKGRLSRRDQHLVRTHVIYLDDIGTKFPIPALPPSSIIESSAGNYQYVYFLKKPISIEEARSLFARMKVNPIGDPGAMTVGRLMRLPMGINGKDGEAGQFQVRLVEAHYERRYSVEELVAAWQLPELPATPQRATQTATAAPADVPDWAVGDDTIKDLRSALQAIPAHDRNTWVSMGMGLHGLGDKGYALWLAWSKTSPKYKQGDEQEWHTFEPTDTGYAAVFAEAQRQGWVNPKSGNSDVVSLEELKKEALVLGGNSDPELWNSILIKALLLSPVEVDDFIDELHKTTGRGVGTIRAQLKEAKKQKKRERKAMVSSTLPAAGVGGARLPQIITPDDAASVCPNFRISDEGKQYPIATAANWYALLQKISVSLYFNLMNKQPEIYGGAAYNIPFDDPEVAYPILLDYGSINFLPMERGRELLNNLAYRNPYHPFDAYIKQAGVWDGVDRIEEVLSAFTTTDVAHFRMLLKPWLISIVAAVHGYGNTPPRGVLTFTGNQNIGKTGALRVISPPNMFREGVTLKLGGYGNEVDSIVQATNCLVVELGELDATFKKSEISSLKSFIGRDEDTYRAPYGHDPRTYKRQTVYCGSVNDPEFLQDKTGNSRFWVVDIDAVNFEKLNAINIQQLWLQVKQLYDNGESWLLNKTEMGLLNNRNEEFREKSAIEVALADKYNWMDKSYLKFLLHGENGEDNKKLQYLTTAEIAKELDVDKQWHSRNQIGRDLRHALQDLTGMVEPKRRKCGDTVKRVWVLPWFFTGMRG